MTFAKWLESAPEELTTDPLWRMKAYRLAVFAGDLAWYDTVPTDLLDDPPIP